MYWVELKYLVSSKRWHKFYIPFGHKTFLSSIHFTKIYIPMAFWFQVAASGPLTLQWLKPWIPKFMSASFALRTKWFGWWWTETSSMERPSNSTFMAFKLALTQRQNGSMFTMGKNWTWWHAGIDQTCTSRSNSRAQTQEIRLPPPKKKPLKLQQRTQFSSILGGKTLKPYFEILYYSPQSHPKSNFPGKKD